MTNVYCVGEMLIDFVNLKANDNAPNKDVFEKKAGGAPANVAVAAQRFGGEAYFLGQVGKDSFGDFLKQTLECEHVDTKYLVQSQKTTLAFVSLDSDGERSFEFFRGGDGEYILQPEIIQTLSSNDIVHFGSATAFLPGQLKESYYQLLECAVQKKSFVSFDPNYRDVLITDLLTFRQDCYNFMRKSNLIKLSEEEVLLLAEAPTLDEALCLLEKETDAIITVTLGASGTLVFHNGKQTVVPSVKIDTLDTTGAGDCFIGTLLGRIASLQNFTELYDTHTLLKSVQYANVAAALTCTKYGAIPAIPTVMEVETKRGECDDVG